jgi:hypothetical protein
VPGNTVAAYLRSLTSASITPFTGSTSGVASFYWVDDGTKTVTYSATLSDNRQFNASVTYVVSRPQLVLTVETSPLIGIREIGGVTRLSFGDADNPGIRFFVEGEMRGEAGTLALTQLANMARTSTADGVTRTFSSSGAYVLDVALDAATPENQCSSCPVPWNTREVRIRKRCPKPGITQRRFYGNIG